MAAPCGMRGLWEVKSCALRLTGGESAFGCSCLPSAPARLGAVSGRGRRGLPPRAEAVEWTDRGREKRPVDPPSVQGAADQRAAFRSVGAWYVGRHEWMQCIQMHPWQAVLHFSLYSNRSVCESICQVWSSYCILSPGFRPQPPPEWGLNKCCKGSCCSDPFNSFSVSWLWTMIILCASFCSCHCFNKWGLVHERSVIILLSSGTDVGWMAHFFLVFLRRGWRHINAVMFFFSIQTCSTENKDVLIILQVCSINIASTYCQFLFLMKYCLCGEDTSLCYARLWNFDSSLKGCSPPPI